MIDTYDGPPAIERLRNSGVTDAASPLHGGKVVKSAPPWCANDVRTGGRSNAVIDPAESKPISRKCRSGT
jgi:hypothetical protein